MPKTLKDCLNFIGIESDDQRIINKITNDSRDCDENTIYIGNKYIEDAFNKKASVLDQKYTRKLINFFYDNPCRNYTIIGVTGTNGKTSITHYLKQILTSLGYKCIRLGTHYNEFEDIKIESINTTMNLMDNLNVFLEHKDKIEFIIMEISSISIEEHRIDFIEFDMIIYTNIYLDHLDYHKTFVQYMYSKFKLRNYLKENGKILINDDFNLHRIYELQRKNVIQYSLNDIEILKNELNEVIFNYKNSKYYTKMNGQYIFINLCACLCCLEYMNIDLNKIYLNDLCNVEGRMEILEINERMIVIDYAHNPISLEETLMYLKQYKKNQLICVFGCGGNRDKSKRPLMSKIACSLCDLVYVTEDNNRYEKFEDIIDDMDLKRFFNVVIVEKRANAILMALTHSQKHDIILIAGKGNEKYIIENGMQIPYNDKSIVMSY